MNIKDTAMKAMESLADLPGVENVIVLISTPGDDGDESMSAAIGNTRAALNLLLGAAIRTAVEALNQDLSEGGATTRDGLPLVLLTLSDVVGAMLAKEGRDAAAARAAAADAMRNMKK